MRSRMLPTRGGIMGVRTRSVTTMTTTMSVTTMMVVIAGLIGMFASGCDGPTIDPFIEGRHFTLYGFLHEFDNEHFVRVIAVRRSPEDIPTPTSPHAEIDGRVTSTNLTTGAQHVWSHSLVQFEDGRYGHVFRATFVVRKGHTYELVVERSDGVKSIAQTTVPNLNDWQVAPAEIRDDTTSQTITWMGVGTPDDISISYCAKPVGALRCPSIVVPYGRSGRRIEEGWEVDVQLSRDLQFVRQQLGVDETLTLELASMDMLFTALDENWVLPEEPFDAEEFAQPGALTNVENGFGFWGSISRSGASWIPDAEALAVSGFVPPQ